MNVDQQLFQLLQGRDQKTDFPMTCVAARGLVQCLDTF